jgi:hypothetical protein
MRKGWGGLLELLSVKAACSWAYQSRKVRKERVAQKARATVNFVRVKQAEQPVRQEMQIVGSLREMWDGQVLTPRTLQDFPAEIFHQCVK